MTEAAIDCGVAGDLYVSLGDPVGRGAWTVRVQLRSRSSTWIWGGCLLMALGGFLAAADRRYRVARGARSALSRQPAPVRSRAAMNRFLSSRSASSSSCWLPLRRPGLNPREVPSPLIGKPAPAFELAQLHTPDHAFAPADMQGQVWLLNVWASWCVSCRDEHPLLVELAKTKTVPMVGLNYKDKPDDAQGAGWSSSAIRTAVGRATPTGASASTTASTACPRPS